MINNFDAAHRLLNHGAKNLNERYPRFRDKLDLFFIDHEWVPLLIQDNYLNSMEKKDSAQDIEAMANASEFISLGDSLNRQIRVNMDWSLLPNYGVCSSIAPCLILKGKSFYPRFPEWLGKNSSQRKSHRQIKELKFAMGSSVQCDYAAIHLEVVPLILLQLHLLISKDRMDEAIGLLDTFHITNEMMKEHLMELCMNKKTQEMFDKLTPTQKSAFTRNYNSSHKDPI